MQCSSSSTRFVCSKHLVFNYPNFQQTIRCIELVLKNQHTRSITIRMIIYNRFFFTEISLKQIKCYYYF